MPFARIVGRPLPEPAQLEVEALINHLDSILSILEKESSKRPDSSSNPAMKEISDSLGIEFSEVKRIFSALENISAIKENTSQPSELVQIVSQRLSTKRSEMLKAKAGDFVKVLDLYTNDHPLHISIKAEKLSFLHENLYQDGEIITDIRPIFDAAGNKILEMIVTHSLVLNSFSYGGGTERTHFAMDAADVLRLRDACERAIKKSATIRDSLGGNEWNVKVLNETV